MPLVLVINKFTCFGATPRRLRPCYTCTLQAEKCTGCPEIREKQTLRCPEKTLPYSVAIGN